MIRVFCSTLLAFVSLNVFAQDESRRLTVDIRKPLRIDYQSAVWNKDSSKVESSVLLIRDAITGRIAKIEVAETGPDTGLFMGHYQLNFQSDASGSEMTPEIYVVPPDLAHGQQGLKTVADMIKEGRLLRKPYFLRLESKGVQAISVYDTKDQALEAYQGFLKTGTGRQIIDRAALAAAQSAKVSAEAKTRLEAETKAESERQQAATLERNRQEEMKKKQAILSAEERAKRKARAKALAEEAMVFYRADKYSEAEKKFQEATELDPENQTYYFQYAVSLFKQEKYERSLVLLDLAKNSGVKESEREYFVGLNHLKMKEYNAAYASFLNVKNSGDETLSPASSFFAGVIDFQNENYDSSHGLFEHVLDTSKDPAIDKQAEAYIEQIANIRHFQELQKTKFFINANLGLIYDSNILSISEADAPTELAGWRWMYGGTVEYRPVYSQKHEFSIAASISDLYSQDKSFQAKSEFQNTDPLSAGLSFPYRWKSELFGKGYQLTLTPALESLLMNADTEGSRETILNSTVLGIDQTFVMNEDWYSTYKLEFRKDDSLISAGADENQSASKITLGTSQMWFRDAKKTTAWIWDLGYAMNNAEGRNQKYNRIDTALTYMAPIDPSWTGTARLAFYNSNYADHVDGRKDNNFGLTLAGRRSIEKLLYFNLAATYMANNSLSAYTYNKYSVMSFLSWDQNF